MVSTQPSAKGHHVSLAKAFNNQAKRSCLHNACLNVFEEPPGVLLSLGACLHFLWRGLACKISYQRIGTPFCPATAGLVGGGGGRPNAGYGELGPEGCLRQRADLASLRGEGYAARLGLGQWQAQKLPFGPDTLWGMSSCLFVVQCLASTERVEWLQATYFLVLSLQ